LPFDAAGWFWHHNLTSAEKITGKLYEEVEPLRLWAYMPEFRNNPNLKFQSINENFCTVLTGPAGLCLSVPIDRPCFFRTAYDGLSKKLNLIYDFALSPDTSPSNQVSFIFDLYSCDPGWGFRSALANYYALYPELFRRYINKLGQWMAFSRISDIDNADEFYFGLQEGAQCPEYDDKIGVLSFNYFVHAGAQVRLKNYNPEKDAPLRYDALVKAVEAVFTHVNYREVGIFNVNEKFAIDKWSVYGHYLAQFNISPRLPSGKWYLKYASDLTRQIKQNKHAVLDGFYYDGLTMGINYRKDHFKYAGYPCGWDPGAKKPFLYNFYSSCEFARALAEQVRPKGQYTMLNGAGDNFFIVPWLDVLGCEGGSTDPGSFRAKFYQKPLLTIMKGNFEQKLKQPEIESYMKRNMAYGIIPGCFDWPPSGLGPGGRYWDHPAYYERDRELFRKYLPLCIEIARAGWEPVTYIRSSHPGILVERFGKAGEQLFWFTVRNAGAETRNAELVLDLNGLGLTSCAKLLIYEPLSGKLIPYSQKTKNTVTLRFQIPPDETLLFQAGKPEMIFDWWKKQAVDIIERGIQMRALDRNKPPRPVHWIDSRCERGQDVSGKMVPILTRGCRLKQWSMLFQKRIEELTLSVKVKAVDFEDKKKQTGICCNCARVTPRFTYYDHKFFSIPDGTYDWKVFEFKITPSEPLRSIELSAAMGNTAKGKLEIAGISLKDQKGNEYIVDPDFEKWYEPQPAILKNKLENEIGLLKDKIGNLSPDNKNPHDLLAIYASCGKMLKTIKAANAENGCRRVIRDIETVMTCLNYCIRISAGINIPHLTGPGEASPEDRIQLDFPPAAFRDQDLKVIRMVNGKKIAADQRKYETVIPSTAVIGSVFSVNGISRIVSKSGEFDISVSHKIRIVLPFSAAVVNRYADSANSEYVAELELTNNSRTERNLELKIAPRDEMEFIFPAVTKLSPLEKKAVKIRMGYKRVEKIKNIPVKIKVSAGSYTREVTVPVLIIPAKANLIKNPAFENGLQHWWHRGNVKLVQENGQPVLQMSNAAVTDSSIALQGVALKQKIPTAFYIRGAAKGFKVNGPRNKSYSLWADIYFTDGSKWYGRTYDFKTGTNDWEEGLLYIEPDKTVKSVTVNLCFRQKSGTVCFDNIILAEDTGRKNNIAPAARISVDSSYEKYNAGPVNDRKIQTASLAYYEHSWCSEDRLSEHYLAFDFAGPVKIGKINIYWSLEGREPMTSKKIFFQLWDNGSWKTVKEISREKTEAVSETVLTEPVRSNRFRLLQPSGAGPAERPGVMWVREVELIEYE
ncbi:MAG: hypothetical protein PHV82_09080, partial [Victivallaceae bacterium]|nr:hypothetical protein [Victivallaceae bacterium]